MYAETPIVLTDREQAHAGTVAVVRVGGYPVSCVVTIVIKDQFDGINLFTEDRRVFTR